MIAILIHSTVKSRPMHELSYNRETPKQNPYIGAETPLTAGQSSSEATPTQGEITVPGPGEVPEETAPETPTTDQAKDTYFYPPSEERPLAQVFEDDLDKHMLAHMAIFPGNENVIVRTFPAPHHQWGQEHQGLDPQEAEKIITNAREQFNVLAGGKEAGTPGIIIPQTFYEVETNAAGRAIIKTIVERAYGTPFLYDHGYNEISDSGQNDQAVQLATELVRYYDTVLRTRPDYFLNDIVVPSQYFITPDNTITLVDTDPLLRSLNTRDGWTFLGENIERLNLWVTCLFQTEHQEAAIRDLKYRISDLRRQCEAVRRTHAITLPGHL